MFSTSQKLSQLDWFIKELAQLTSVCERHIGTQSGGMDMTVQITCKIELFMKESKFLIHGNGKDNPPTGFMFEKQQMHGLYFNQSPAKEVHAPILSVWAVKLAVIAAFFALSLASILLASRPCWFMQFAHYILCPHRSEYQIPVSSQQLTENCWDAAPADMNKIFTRNEYAMRSEIKSESKVMVEIVEMVVLACKHLFHFGGGIQVDMICDKVDSPCDP
ncbi:hypothetical protein Tco_1155517 [Tanacetum coccineum]